MNVYVPIIVAVLTGVITPIILQRSLTKATRRKMEEDTTDVILNRVRAELKRAYEIIDARDRRIRRYETWLRVNKEKFGALGINNFPEVWDEGADEIGVEL